MITRLLTVLALSALGSGSAIASSDAALWLEAGAQFKPSKKVALSLAQNVRIHNNISQLESLKTDLSAGWKLKKWLRIGGGYRFTMKVSKKGNLKPSHRIHIQGQLSHDLGPVGLSYRLRFQEQLKPDDVLELTHTVRNRIGAKYDTNTVVDPNLSLELFTRFDDVQAVQMQKLRVTTGLEFRPHKTQSIGLFYRMQMPTFDVQDPTEHIIGLNYTYQIKRAKKNKR